MFDDNVKYQANFIYIFMLQTQLGERGAAFATELEPLLDDALPEICLAARRTLEQFKTGRDAVPSLPSLPKVQEVPALEPPSAGADFIAVV